jgi:Mn2+/Fe2+ NRAMP family transporter
MILLSQDVNGLILPAILVYMLILVNDRRLMGRYTNGRAANAVAGVTVAGLIVLTALLLSSAVPGSPLRG